MAYNEMVKWSTEETRRLMALWDSGLSTAEIGRLMGRSKNSVIGRVHRLHLPQRPSPIQPNPGGKEDGKAVAGVAQP